MDLKNLGYDEIPERLRSEYVPDGFAIGRVVREHKERYGVLTATGEYDAEITGNMRFTAKGREDFPAVGDWVGVVVYDNRFALIHKVFPRYSLLKRQAVGQQAEVQVIAANIDYAFLVQAVDRDFNVNRLERYLTICYAGNVNPVAVFTKVDLANENRIDDIKKTLNNRVQHLPFFFISNETKEGYEGLYSFIKQGKTYCLLGSSGVGKSTLLNNLSGKNRMKTGSISPSTLKGKHVTSHRELIILEQGGIIIDTPGMKEVGIADTTGGLEMTFDVIQDLSRNCRFKDCTHVQEKGCAVLQALASGELDEALYTNYLRMEREKTHYESTVFEKRKKERIFGKMMKNYKKGRENDQF